MLRLLLSVLVLTVLVLTVLVLTVLVQQLLLVVRHHSRFQPRLLLTGGAHWMPA